MFFLPWDFLNPVFKLLPFFSLLILQASAVMPAAALGCMRGVKAGGGWHLSGCQSWVVLNREQWNCWTHLTSDLVGQGQLEKHGLRPHGRVRTAYYKTRQKSHPPASCSSQEAEEGRFREKQFARVWIVAWNGKLPTLCVLLGLPRTPEMLIS